MIVGNQDTKFAHKSPPQEREREKLSRAARSPHAALLLSLIFLGVQMILQRAN
jgi:hypothetical protein